MAARTAPRKLRKRAECKKPVDLKCGVARGGGHGLAPIDPLFD